MFERREIRHGLTEVDYQCVIENGGTGEGAILGAQVFGPDPDKPGAIFSCLYSIRAGVKGRIGEKITIPTEIESTESFHLSSLLLFTDPSLKENWPAFLWPDVTWWSALSGVLVHNFQGLTRFRPDGPLYAKVNEFHALDILKVKIPPERSDGYRHPSDYSKKHPGRKITLISKDGERTLTVSEKWQENLTDNFPLRVRSWNEILTLIEE